MLSAIYRVQYESEKPEQHKKETQKNKFLIHSYTLFLDSPHLPFRYVMLLSNLNRFAASLAAAAADAAGWLTGGRL